MIIDSKDYSGICICGQNHKMETEFCIIECGCMKKFDLYTEKYGLKGTCVAIYDSNTYKISDTIHPRATKEIILPAENLHANERGVELAMREIPENCDYLIAFGSGTIHDITRYCAYLLGIPFVSCPTAASVDGFCSSVAAMTWEGCKKTLTAVSPKIVIADLNIIANAPARLTKSGFGDMIGKYIALADWRISSILTNEYFCSKIHDMTLEAATAVVESTDGISKGDTSSYEKLTYGLLISGLAMQLLGNSRCASGSEHHISHIIEMQPDFLTTYSSNALHGEKVGVGTLMACREYHRLASLRNVSFSDYPSITTEYINEIFGPTLGASIVCENRNDCAADITSALLEEKWNDICNVISQIPHFDNLLEKYSAIGALSTLSDISLPEFLSDKLLDYSPLVRNRVTLMRLRRAIKHS